MRANASQRYTQKKSMRTSYVTMAGNILKLHILFPGLKQEVWDEKTVLYEAVARTILIIRRNDKALLGLSMISRHIYEQRLCSTS
jgi:hypothetical protein